MVQDPQKAEDRLYARKFGDWVTARVEMRVDACYGIPASVKTFLDQALQKKAGNSKTEEAPYEVLGWLIKTIEEPSWPEPHSKDPEPDTK